MKKKVIHKLILTCPEEFVYILTIMNSIQFHGH